MKQTFAILILFINCSIITAQHADYRFIKGSDNPVEIIKSYRDSIVEALNNNNDKDIDRLIKVKLICNCGFASDSIQIIYFRERTILDYISSEFNHILSDVNSNLDFHDYSNKEFNKPEYYLLMTSVYDSLYLKALDILTINYNRVVQNIDFSDISKEEKEFLKLYLNSIVSYKDLKSLNTDKMTLRTKNFLDSFPNSKLNSFANKSLYYDYRQSRFGFAAFLVSGYYMLNSGLGDYLANYYGFGLLVELTYNNFVANFDILGGPSQHPKQSFLYNNNDWNKDSLVSIINGQMLLGYTILNNQKFKITPLIGYSGTGISMNDKIGDIFPDKRFTACIDIDWKLGYYKTYGSYMETFMMKGDNTYWSLRFRLGFQNVAIPNYNKMNGNIVFVNIGLGFLSNPPVNNLKKHKTK